MISVWNLLKTCNMIKALKFINEIINTFVWAMGTTLVVIVTLNMFEIKTIIIIGICSLILNIGLSLTIKRMQKEKEEDER